MILPNGMDVPVLEQQTFMQKVAQNAEVALKSGSTYVVAIAGILGVLYASMTTTQQTQLVEAWPILKGWTPIVTLLVAFFVAKLKPSDAVSSQTKALTEELVRLRLNVYYRQHGLPELPLPAPTPLPVVPVVEPIIPPPPPVVAMPPVMPPAPPRMPARAEPPIPKWADTEAQSVAPAPAPAPAPESFAPRVPWPFPTADATAEDKAWQAAQPPPAPPPPQPETVDIPVPANPAQPVDMPAHVDIRIPVPLAEPAPRPKLPIDPRLLLSLVKEYLEATTK